MDVIQGLILCIKRLSPTMDDAVLGSESKIMHMMSY